VNYLAEFSEAADAEITDLPDMAIVELEKLIHRLERNPRDSDENPVREWERSATFGRGGEGLIVFWIDDDKRKIWIQHAAWLAG
jgi:hypothetical protein